MSNWPNPGTRRLLDRLQIEHPIIGAPMTRVSTPELAAAVSNAGGLGSLGAGAVTLDSFRADWLRTRELTKRPINVNFFVHREPRTNAVAPAVRQRFQRFADELGVALLEVAPPYTSFGAAALELVCELKPEVISFHFGLPAPDVLAKIKALGSVVLASATSVHEAELLEKLGVDAIIAQGSEAGGHRGTFAVPFAGGLVGTMALVPQVVDAVHVPVIAAGGIADARGIVASFALGASAVQIGTAFLLTPEARVDPTHRLALRSARSHSTRVTKLLSGRPARAIVNRLIDEAHDLEESVPEFPLQAALIDPLRTLSSKRGSPDFLAMWAGQAAALAREIPAADLVQALVFESQRLLGSLAQEK